MGCRNAQRQPLPENIRLPSGGQLAFIAREGRMLTAPARDDCADNPAGPGCSSTWKQRRVQGKIAREGTDLFCAVMHPRLYTAVPIPTRWQTLALIRRMVTLLIFRASSFAACGLWEDAGLSSSTLIRNSCVWLRRRLAVNANLIEPAPCA